MDDDVNDNFVRCLKLSTLLLPQLLLLLLLEKEEATWIGSNLLRSTSEQITEDRTQIECTIIVGLCRHELILYSSTTKYLYRLIDRQARQFQEWNRHRGLRREMLYQVNPVMNISAFRTSS